MLSYASKGHNFILMFSYIFSYLKLYYDIINVMLLSDDVTYLFVLYSVVSKHLLMALSVLCLIVELTVGTRKKHLNETVLLSTLNR